ncbi:MAG: DUF3299 domain-containing protein [Deltaproteobacteria bacterium]|jgi:hypothetical protein|nr:DUF3299 domain-containing protein [Deltaproteobacteria bacterium]
MKYRHIFLTAFLAMLCVLGTGHILGASSQEQGDAAEKSANDSPGVAEKDGRHTLMTWDDLLPPNWNPAELFAGLNFDKLDDNDPRVDKAMKKLMKMWDEAPVKQALQGKSITISGYVASLDFTGKSALKEFLLVPYFGACIHVPPPPANQIIHVTLTTARKGIRSMDQVTVSGRLAVTKTETEMGRSGYSMKADTVEPYPGR